MERSVNVRKERDLKFCRSWRRAATIFHRLAAPPNTSNPSTSSMREASQSREKHWSRRLLYQMFSQPPVAVAETAQCLEPQKAWFSKLRMLVKASDGKRGWVRAMEDLCHHLESHLFKIFGFFCSIHR